MTAAKNNSATNGKNKPFDIEELFRRCNETYFGGRLPQPSLAVTRARTRLGSFSCKWQRSLRGRRMAMPKICISSYYALTSEQQTDVMAHEMIHYYIALNRLKDTSAHGKLFRGMMEELNRRHGLHISVSSNASKLPRALSHKPKKRLLLAMRLADGRCLLSAVSPASAPRIEIQIRHTAEISWHKWAETSNPDYSEWPQVRTLRGRIVTEEQMLKALEEPQPAR